MKTIITYNLLLELFITHISILILLYIIPQYYKILGIISIPILLYIILYNSNIIHYDIKMYCSLSIITIIIYLILERMLEKYKYNSIISNQDDNELEQFTDKIKKFKNSESVKTFNMNNRAKLSKKKIGLKKHKQKHKNREDFNNSKIHSAENFKDDINAYYNSFNKGILKKKSKSTSQSIEKFYVLKDKLMDLF